MLRVRVCGGLHVDADGRSLPDALVGGRQGRLVFAYLVCRRSDVVRKEELAELLWADRLPDSWSASLSAVVSRLRRLLTEAGLDGSAAIATTTGGCYQLVLPPDTSVDFDELAGAAEAAEAAAAAGDVERALEAATIAEVIAARGFLKDDCDWVDRQRDVIRDLRVRAALARSEAHLRAGVPVRAVEAARGALALDESRESAYRQLMRALAAVGERGEALRVWERCRTTLVEELGVDPSPATEAVYLDVLGAGPASEPSTRSLPSGVVTFLLTDIVESSELWDNAPDAMAVALERHDAIVAELVAAHGGTLLKSKLEGDATVSVFARASDGAAAALHLQDAVAREPWPDGARPRVRMALHTGEAFERGGDYFGPALNRAARLRSLASAGEVLLSQAVTEVVRDRLPAGAALRDLGHRDLRGLSRGENVYQLTRAVDTARGDEASRARDTLTPPALPGPLASTGPFVGRRDELTRLVKVWADAAQGALGAVFIGGEPGVGKSRLAGEVAAHAHASGAIVLYGRCDEDVAAPLQPFIEALRSLIPALGPTRIRSVRGVEELARVMPELAEQLPDRGPAVRADPDTERLALFDAVMNVVRAASTEAPVLLVLDDLHWAGKTTLSLLRHLLRGGKDARLLVVGTYRDTELARSHPLAETLADLRRDSNAQRISLGGLGAEDIEAYLAAVGIDDRALGRELAEVTSGNPFFLIEVLRHVQETGGTWSPGNLPEGVREATGRRLSRLSDATNRALAVAAVIGIRFDLALVEQVEGTDLVDEIAEACQAGLVVEEPGAIGRFRFAHALVRQVLLAELVTVKRVRLHKRIAELLEAAPVGDDPDARLADLAYHWSECASLGDADKAVGACRRAADRAMERLAYEEAGDLYGMALQVLDDGDDRDGERRAELHIARCDALLTAGDVAGARLAIDALELVAHGSERLAAWYTTYEGQLAVLAEPDRLTEIVQSIGAAAGAMRAIGDLRGEARAHYVHASALERLGQIGSAERALDAALGAARSADDRRLADAILAEAPPAALWGPSSVTRASGRCLDVIRVLRIHDGAPAVESVALRCQAVLEALRGRTEAGRRMVASARRTVERLGLTHRQLETDVAAGLIELLDGNAPDAETLLRAAYQGLRERGLDGEAAQAAAFLGRSLLLQDRVDEADQMAAEAEALAGADLKAAIAWRGVRAEAAARRGDPTRALALARDAVQLAAATDALLLDADARLALATVLRTTGDNAGAEAEARRVVEACEAKGATALAARARGARPHSAPDDVTALRGPVVVSPVPGANQAMAAVIRFHEAFNRGDFDAVEATATVHCRYADRRPLMQTENRGHAAAVDASLTLSYDSGARFEDAELLVARGDRAALVRWKVRAPGSEWSHLAAVRVDETGRFTDFVVFDHDARRSANVELEHLAPMADEHTTTAWRAVSRVVAAANAHDWDGVVANLAPDFRAEDRRPGVGVDDAHADALRTLFSLDDWAMERTAIELYGDRRVLCRDVVWFRDGAVADAEVATLLVIEVDDAGRIARQVGFDPNDLDAATAELATGVERVAVPANEAMVAAIRFGEAFNRGDFDAVEANRHPQIRFVDRRPLMQEEYRGNSDADFASLALVYEIGARFEPPELLVARGTRAALTRWQVRAPGAEWSFLAVVRVDDAGRLTDWLQFDVGDRRAANLELHAVASVEPEHETTAWRAARGVATATTAHDWDDLVAWLAPGYQLVDRRPVVHGGTTDPLEDLRLLFSLDDWALERTAIALYGDRRVLCRDTVWFRDGAVGDAEVAQLSVLEVDDSGRVARQVCFGADDLDEARAELHAGGADERSARRQPAVEVEPNAAWRATERLAAAINARDWDQVVACLSADFSYHDRRSTMLLDQHGDDALSIFRTAFELDQFSIALRLVATRGEHLALIEQQAVFQDGWSGPSEVATLTVVEVDDDGNVRARVLFEPTALSEALAELDARYAGTQVPPRFANTAWRSVAGMGGDLVGSRGDLLALVRTRTGLLLVEADDAGNQVATVSFRGDDMDAALDALDERYSATSPTLRSASRWTELIGRQEWAGLADLLTPDSVLDDRRPARFGVVQGRDAVVDLYRALTEIVDEIRVRTLHVVEGSNGTWLAVGGMVGVANGAPFETPLVAITWLDDDGRTTRRELYDLEQLDEAWARLGEVAATAADPADPFRNAVDDTGERFRRAWAAHDWNAVVDCFAPGFRWENRQPLTPFGLEEGAKLDGLRPLLDESEWGEWTSERLATRGNRLALYRQTYCWRTRISGPAEFSWLAVMENDDVGRFAGVVLLDPDALDAAYDELDERYACGDAAPFAAAWATSRQLIRAYNDRVLEPWPLQDGYTVEYHSPASFGQLDAEGFAAGQAALTELSPDLRIRVDHVLGFTDRANSTVVTTEGVDREGGRWEATRVNVNRTDRSGRPVHTDLYDLDQLDEAKRRYADLLAEASLDLSIDDPLAIPYDLPARSVGESGSTLQQRPH